MSSLPPRPGIMDITPYVGGESKLPGVDRVIKLASNEGPFGPSPKAMEAFKETAPELHRYPDGGAWGLTGAIAEKYGIDRSRIVCGAGSDEILGLLCRAYAGPGDEVLYSDHGFLMYYIAAKTAGATPVTAPEVDLTANVDNLLAAVNEKTKIVFLANPNNPTGTYISKAELERLHAGLPNNVVFVIDAAYAEFIEEADYEAGIELANKHDNVIMTRTFSKLYGLGGLRIGWAYGSAEIIDVLHRVRNPFNTSNAAQAAALGAVNDDAFVEKTLKHNRKWLEWTTEEARRLGLTVPDSYANFVLIRFPEDDGKTAEAADAFLRQRGLIVRRMVPYKLADSLRVTIGLEDEMRLFVEALRDYMRT